LNDCLDENLVAACRNGDRTAYAVLAKRHYRHVFAVCLGVLGNAHDAEDIAQEAMLKGFTRIRKLRNGSRFETWVLRIARNLCIDFLRRQKHIKAVPAQQPSRSIQTANENHDLQQAIQRLPQELRLPLVMYYFDNKNSKAIAKKLNISHSGVCQRIRTARKQLHKMLTEEVRNE